MIVHDVELLRAACCIAGLDGDVAEKERRIIDHLAEKAGVGAASLKAMLDRARTDQSFYKEMFRMLRLDANRTVRTLYFVAVADGVLKSEERIVLHHFGKKLGLTDEGVEAAIDLAKAEIRRGRDGGAWEQSDDDEAAAADAEAAEGGEETP